MAQWPLVGRLVRIGVAVIRLPERNARLAELEERVLPELVAKILDINHGLFLLEKKKADGALQQDTWTRHIPAFLNAISTVNAFGFQLSQQRKHLEKIILESDEKHNILSKEFEDFKCGLAASQDPNSSARILNANLNFISRAEALTQHLPAFLNSVTTVNAFGFQLLQLRKLFEKNVAKSDERYTALEHRLEDITKVVDLEENITALPALHNLEAAKRIDKRIDDIFASQNQHWKEIGRLWERLEFIRKELMFELKYNSPKNSLDQTRFGRTLNEPKMQNAPETGVRLNLGSGHVPLKDFLNVDMRDVPGVDIISQVDDLPFGEGTVQEIFSAHVLEHFPQEELRRKLLPYWSSLLRDDGLFRAITPDAEAMISHLSAGTYSFEDFREVFFGGQEYEGDFHFNMFTPESLSSLLTEAGFRDIAIMDRGRKNGKCFEFEIKAVRGLDEK